jgi:G3E family GTPase|tara:strand:+ start:412 stop:1026 length:615 start_codon:yes stop_codon:yes gene_type:complete
LKIVLTSGLLGSGKTSLINYVSGIINKDKNHHIGVILNNHGEEQINQDLYVRYIPQESLSTLALPPVQTAFRDILIEICHNENLDFLFIELTGIGRSWILKNQVTVVSEALDIYFTYAPIINVVDCSRIELMLRSMRKLLKNGILESDYVVLNKIDLASKEMIDEAETIVKNFNPNSKLFHVSTKTGEGINAICKLVYNDEIRY